MRLPNRQTLMVLIWLAGSCAVAIGVAMLGGCESRYDVHSQSGEQPNIDRPGIGMPDTGDMKYLPTGATHIKPYGNDWYSFELVMEGQTRQFLAHVWTYDSIAITEIDLKR